VRDEYLIREPLGVLIALGTIAVGAGAQDITGTILIKKKLTKRSVTAPVSIYQRGTVVGLGKDADGDEALAFERSRVVVYIEGPQLGGSDLPKPDTPSMQQLNRQFSRDIVVIPVGAAVSFPTMDPIFNNVFSLSKPRNFDLGSYNRGDSRSVVFLKAGVVYVYCHPHPNTEATILVTPNRRYARSNAAGHYRISGVPPGRYTVVAWHKAAGFFRKTSQVAAGQDSAADFFIPIGDSPTGEDSPLVRCCA
jgi:plastocyanin